MQIAEGVCLGFIPPPPGTDFFHLPCKIFITFIEIPLLVKSMEVLKSLESTICELNISSLLNFVSCIDG